jgi:hypothetical protein
MGMQDRDWYKELHRERARRDRWRAQLPQVTWDRAMWFIAGASAWAAFERYVLPWLMRGR